MPSVDPLRRSAEAGPGVRRGEVEGAVESCSASEGASLSELRPRAIGGAPDREDSFAAFAASAGFPAAFAARARPRSDAARRGVRASEAWNCPTAPPHRPRAAAPRRRARRQASPDRAARSASALRLERRRPRERRQAPGLSFAASRIRPSSSSRMICAISFASRSGSDFAAVPSGVRAPRPRAPDRPAARWPAPSANSSSMLSKEPCPFIGAQSPLSTTSRALIEASSLFSDIGAEASADLALDVRVGRIGQAGLGGQEGAGAARGHAATSAIASRAFANRPCCRYWYCSHDEAVEVVLRRRSPLPLARSTDAANADSSDADRLVPHAERQEHVRRHVARVARGRRDARVGARRLAAPSPHARRRRRRAARSARRPGCCGFFLRMASAIAAGLQRHRRIRARPAGSSPAAPAHRTPPPRRRLDSCARSSRHAIGVGAVARRLVAVAEQALDRVEIRLLARGRRLRLPRGRRRRQPAERRARLGEVLVEPQRLVVGERFAPVRHREAGIGLLRLPEAVDRVVVLEAVEKQHAADERRLRLRRSGSRKGDAPEERRAPGHSARASQGHKGVQQRPAETTKAAETAAAQSEILLCAPTSAVALR